MVENEHPAKEIATEVQRHGPVEVPARLGVSRGRLEDKRKELIRQLRCCLVKRGIDRYLLLSGGNLLVEDVEGGLLHRRGLGNQKREQLRIVSTCGTCAVECATLTSSVFSSCVTEMELIWRDSISLMILSG